jgi:hypothetical protein
MEGPLPSPTFCLGTIGVGIICEDTLFYWVHRLLVGHLEPLLRPPPPTINGHTTPRTRAAHVPHSRTPHRSRVCEGERLCHCACHGFDIAILLTSLACVSSQHTPMFYKRIHKMHHDFRMPNGFAAEYAHPVELVISNMMPLMMGPLVVALVTGRCHQVATLCWVIFRMFETVDAHCGYDLPFSPFGFFPMRPSSVSLWQGSGGGGGGGV